MARPTKAITLSTQKVSNSEKAQRAAQEKKLKGETQNLKPPKYLNLNQKKIFRFIVKELEASEILGNLDVFMLCKTSIAIDRLQSLEERFNKSPYLMENVDIIRLQGVYSKDFYRCCNELSLSPQSRAKIANNTIRKTKDDNNPLLQLIKGGQSG